MNRYQEKLEAQRERYAERAEKARAESAAAYKTFDRISSAIPLGQPILIGHHSEKRHRRDIARIDRALHKSVDASKRADHYADKAESYGTHGISSDDPEAVARLKTKLLNLEMERDHIKRINAAYRKGGFDAVASDENPDVIAKLKHDMEFFKNDRPFPGYKLTNLGAEIRRTKERIDQLEKKQAEPESEPIQGNGFRIEEDQADNRILVVFDSKPPREICDVMKSNGFRWSPTRGAWCRMLNNSGRYAAKCVATKLGGAA